MIKWIARHHTGPEGMPSDFSPQHITNVVLGLQLRIYDCCLQRFFRWLPGNHRLNKEVFRGLFLEAKNGIFFISLFDLRNSPREMYGSCCLLQLKTFVWHPRRTAQYLPPHRPPSVRLQRASQPQFPPRALNPGYATLCCPSSFDFAWKDQAQCFFPQIFSSQWLWGYRWS